MVYDGLYSYRQCVHVITIFPNIFFVLFLHVEQVCKSFSERKVWHIRPFAWCRTCALSSSSRCFQLSTNLDKDLSRFLLLSLILWKKQIECGLVWSILLSTTIRIITVVKICCGLMPHKSKTFWPLWLRVSLTIRVQNTLNTFDLLNL